MKIKSVNELDLSKVVFEKPTKNGRKYFSQLLYEGEPLYIQFKTKLLSQSKTSDNFLSLKCESSGGLHEIIDSLEKFSVDYCLVNSNEWFNKQLPREFIYEAFKSNISILEEAGTSCVKSYVTLYEGLPNVSVYDSNKNHISLSKELYGKDMSAIIHVNGLWVSNKTIGLSVNMSQMKINKEFKRFVLTEYSIDDSEDELCDLPSEDETGSVLDNNFLDDILK